jgi:hypothetical protein
MQILPQTQATAILASYSPLSCALHRAPCTNTFAVPGGLSVGGIFSRGGCGGTSGQGAHAVAHAPNDCVGALLLGLGQSRQPHQKGVDQVLTTLLSQRVLDRCLGKTEAGFEVWVFRYPNPHRGRSEVVGASATEGEAGVVAACVVFDYWQGPQGTTRPAGARTATPRQTTRGRRAPEAGGAIEQAASSRASGIMADTVAGRKNGIFPSSPSEQDSSTLST